MKLSTIMLGTALIPASCATLTVRGVTSTQAVAVLSCTQPGAGTITVSESPSFTPLVNATDSTKGGSSASMLDNGNTHTFIIGARTSKVGNNGNLYSQALQAVTTHYAQGTCPEGTSPTVPFTTVNPPHGNTYPEPPPFDATAPFNYAYPTVAPIPIGAQTTFVNDPITGIAFGPVTKAGLFFDTRGFQTKANLDAVAAKDVSGNGNWTSVSSAFLIDGSSATNAGANQDALYVRFPPFCAEFISASPAGSALGCGGTEAPQDSFFGIMVDDVQLQLATGCTGSTASFQVALTANAVTPATDWQTIPCSTTPATCVGHAQNCIFYPATANWPSTRHAQTVFANWFAAQANNRTTRFDMSNQTGTVSVVNTTGVVTWATGDKFRPSSLAVGSWININGVDFKIAAVLSPISITVAAPPADGTYNYRIANFGVLIRKAAATTGTLTVDGVEYSDAESEMGQSPMSGLVDFCSPTTVTDSGGNVIQPCFFIQNSDRALYGLEVGTGKSRFISTANVIGCASGNCASSSPGSALNNYGSTTPTAWQQFNPNNPAIWYAFNTNGAGGQTFLIQSTYNTAGGSTCPGDWQEITPTNCPGFPNNDAVTQDNLTPASSGNDIPTKALAYNTAQRALHPEIPPFDPNIWSSIIVGSGAGDSQNGWQTLHFGPQDGYNYDVILDPTAVGIPVVGMIPTWSAGNIRFCGDHGSGTRGGIWGMSAKAIGSDSAAAGVGSGLWQAQVTTSLDTTSVSCSGITDPRFTQYNGKAKCRTITITEPCHTQNKAVKETSPTFGTCSWNSAYANFAGVVNQPGDVIDDGSDSGEMMLIVSIPSAGQAQVVRGYATTAPVFARGPVIATHAATWLTRERCTVNDGTSGHGGINWVDIAIDPNALATNSATTGVVDFASQINGHLDYWFFPTYSTLIQGGQIRTRPTPKSSFYNVPFDATVSQSGIWNTYLSGMNASPGYIQSHQGSSRENANPFYGIDQNALGDASAASSTLWNQNATFISGSLWKIASADVNKDSATPWPSGIKSIPFVVASGGYLLKDISGPTTGNAILDTAADNYKFCIVYVSGECRSGSSAGEVYINRPASAHDGKCGPWDFTNNLCASTWDPRAATANQYDYSWVTQNGSNLQDSSGRAFRRLSSVLNRIAYQVVFASAHGSLSGKWAFAAADLYGGGNRGDFFVLKLPPRPALDSIQRNGFVNIPVTLGAGTGSATKIRARFGYGEYGTPSQFYCAYNRKEECRTEPTPTIASPYYFAGDTGQLFQDCSSGCTVNIPAIPGRVLYYVIDRLDTSGNVINSTPVQTAVMP